MSDPAAQKDLTGKPFERLVAAVQKKLDGDADVEWDARVRGSSGTSRQVDVAIRGRRGSAKLFIAVEAKDYDDKVDIALVEQFIAKLKDIGGNKGIMVASNGFTRDALLRARQDGIDTCVLRPANNADWKGRIGGFNVKVVIRGVTCEGAELVLVGGQKMPIPEDGDLALVDENGQVCDVADVALRLLNDHKEADGQTVDFTINDPKFYIWENGRRGVQVVGMGGCFRLVEKFSKSQLIKAPHDWVFVRHLPDGIDEEEKSFFVFKDLEKLADDFKKS